MARVARMGGEGDAKESDADAALLRDVGRRVRAARASRRLSRRELAERSGVSERYLAQLETGSGNISILLLRRIAAATGTALEDLVAGGTDADTLALVGAVRRVALADRDRLKAFLVSLGSAHGDGARAGRVALIGLRGAGKSTLGPMVATALEAPFVELNREIETESGLAVGEIFSLYGDQGYRRLESRCLDRVIARHDRVILAVAGGIVAEESTFADLLRSFHTVWLRAAPEEHMARVRAQGDRRPMAGSPDAMAELRAILEGRERLYARAEAILDTSGRAVADSARELADLIGTRWPAATSSQS